MLDGLECCPMSSNMRSDFPVASSRFPSVLPDLDAGSLVRIRTSVVPPHRVSIPLQASAFGDFGFRFSPDKRISEAANSFNLIPTFRTCMSRSFSRSRSGGCSAGARTNNPVWRPTAQPRTANASIHQIMGCLWADAPRTALTQRDFARLFSRALPTHSRLGPYGACAIR